MPRARKTRDLWEIYVNYGAGWEYECASYSRKEARDDLKAYRKNAPQYPARIKKTRERISPTV